MSAFELGKKFVAKIEEFKAKKFFIFVIENPDGDFFVDGKFIVDDEELTICYQKPLHTFILVDPDSTVEEVKLVFDKYFFVDPCHVQKLNKEFKA